MPPCYHAFMSSTRKPRKSLNFGGQADKNKAYFNNTANKYSEKELVDFDYFVSFPIYDKIVSACKERNNESPRVADVGAGVGISSIPLLERGCRVTAVDVADSALGRLRERAGFAGDSLATVCAEGSEFFDEAILSGRRFDVVLCRALLHHIPDYLAFVNKAAEVVAPGGYFISIADPLRYDSISRFEYFYARATYYSMRLFKGNYLRGLKTLMRRSRGTLSEDLPEDNVEYHIVRNGVDQDAIKKAFEKLGFDCEIIPYFGWNNPIMSPLGRKLGIRSSFAVVAKKGDSGETAR